MSIIYRYFNYTPEYEYTSSMHWIVIFTCISIGLITLHQIILILNGKCKPDKTKFRHLYLAILFLLYNLSNILLTRIPLSSSAILQKIISYSISSFMCIYLIWYLCNAVNIKIYRTKNSTLITSISALSIFLVPYLYTNSLDTTKSLFLILPTLSLLVFFIFYFNVIKEKVKGQNNFKIQTYLVLSSILSIVTLPIPTYFGDYQPITQPLVCMSFFLVTTMEINSYIYKLKYTYPLVFDINNQYNLTHRENEIALQMVNGDCYKKIAKNMFIAYGTVRKHASNIFIKLGCNNKDEFINKFKK
ncbi:helix-turn-helix transcriptional regulator [Joostella atrarenae]|uniref:Helix-turn-helix transcriptional regulator n=1 Tax=Joostella atrarenae TaxID=679257 RepID=A0ABS9J2K1_9FLAO|nr:helix-turn-helix transcriptional regulator [Joostella atrarenae]MCF8714662.1 helix-turn-helix transcriptional regulator [Joostella atrarenae]